MPYRSRVGVHIDLFLSLLHNATHILEVNARIVLGAIVQLVIQGISLIEECPFHGLLSALIGSHRSQTGLLSSFEP